MRGGALGPFAYVMPALSKTGANAAFYSDTFRPAGVTRLKLGSDDARRARRRAVLPLPRAVDRGRRSCCTAATSCPRRRIVAEPFEVEAFGIDGAMFTAEPDPETNFKLFGPVAARGDRRQDDKPRLCAAAAAEPGFCRRAGRLSAGSAASCARGFTAASAPPSARISPMAATSCRSRPSLRSRAGDDRAGRRRHAGSGARCRAGRLSRRHRRGPADARRQSGADDDGAGARGGVSPPWLPRCGQDCVVSTISPTASSDGAAVIGAHSRAPFDVAHTKAFAQARACCLRSSGSPACAGDDCWNRVGSMWFTALFHLK